MKSECLQTQRKCVKIFRKVFVRVKNYNNHIITILPEPAYFCCGRVKSPISTHTGCPKKRGISDCYSVYFTALFIWNLDYSFLIHLKIEIHMFVPSTEPFLSDIREQRNKCLKYQICHQLLASFKSSSIITIIHKLKCI